MRKNFPFAKIVEFGLNLTHLKLFLGQMGEGQENMGEYSPMPLCGAATA